MRGNSATFVNPIPVSSVRPRALALQGDFQCSSSAPATSPGPLSPGLSTAVIKRMSDKSTEIILGARPVLGACYTVSL